MTIRFFAMISLAVVLGPLPLPLREARRRWAELLRQIFEVDPLRYPQCGAEMRIVAFITAPHAPPARLKFLSPSSR